MTWHIEKGTYILQVGKYNEDKESMATAGWIIQRMNVFDKVPPLKLPDLRRIENIFEASCLDGAAALLLHF